MRWTHKKQTPHLIHFPPFYSPGKWFHLSSFPSSSYSLLDVMMISLCVLSLIYLAYIFYLHFNILLSSQSIHFFLRYYHLIVKRFSLFSSFFAMPMLTCAILIISPICESKNIFRIHSVIWWCPLPGVFKFMIIWLICMCSLPDPRDADVWLHCNARRSG